MKEAILGTVSGQQKTERLQIVLRPNLSLAAQKSNFNFVESCLKIIENQVSSLSKYIASYSRQRLNTHVNSVVGRVEQTEKSHQYVLSPQRE